MTLADDAFKAMWSDWDDAHSFPVRRPVLAHYTSVPTLVQILTNNEFWLSHPLLMNDHQEMKWGLTEAQRLLASHAGIAKACREEERYDTFMKHFDTEYEEYTTTYAYDVYVACFCEHQRTDPDGLLSMWRAYGANGGGVAIVFDTTKLKANEDSPLILSPVTYATQEERVSKISSRIDALANFINEHQPDSDGLKWCAKALFSRFAMLAIFTKHKGFREEDEWRLAYMPDRDTADSKYARMISYAVSERGAQPKLKLQFGPGMEDGVDLNSVISQILLGPALSAPLSVVATQRMLRTIRPESELADSVVASGIPLKSGR